VSEWASLPPTLGLLDVGPLEMLVLTVAAIILFGGDLPDLARRAGQLVGRLRAAAHELTRQIEPPPDLTHLPDPDHTPHRAPPPLGAPTPSQFPIPPAPPSTPPAAGDPAPPH
jgi:Sec-independent protein translocase protein TatA